MVTPETSLNMSMGAFLASLKLETLREIFDREHINVEILADMGHEDLRQIGITAFGHRYVIYLPRKIGTNGPILDRLTIYCQQFGGGKNCPDSEASTKRR